MNKLIAAIEKKDIPKALDLINKNTLKSKTYNLLYSLMGAPYYAVFTNALPPFKGGLLFDHDIFYDAPLLMAVRYGLVEVVSALLAAGVPVDSKDRHGRHTALHVAVALGRDECVRVLVNAGADIHAYAHGSCDAVGIYIDPHIPHAEDVYYTPLYIAVVSCDFETVKLLIDNGAHARGGVARKLADSSYQVDETICNTLIHTFMHRNYAPLPKRYDNVYEKERRFAIVDLLLNNGANPNTFIKCNINRFEDYSSVLAIAVNTEDERLIDRLLRAGANIHAEVDFAADFQTDLLALESKKSADGKRIALLSNDQKNTSIIRANSEANKNKHAVLLFMGLQYRKESTELPIEINKRIASFVTPIKKAPF